MRNPENDPQATRWQEFVHRLQDDPAIPFETQWRRFREIFHDRDPSLGPPPVWIPNPEAIAESNIGRLMGELEIEDYRELHRWSVSHRAEFWRRAIDRLGIVFSREPDEILDLTGGPSHPAWLPGAELNIVDSCFQSSDCTIAVALGQEGSDELATVTYGDLEALVNRVANGLGEHDFSPGDAIALYMPMNLECVAAYLGIIRAGCAVVSIADSFAPPEIRRRLEISGAAGIVTVDSFSRGGRSIALYDKVCEAEAPRAVVIPTDGLWRSELRGGDLLWQDFLSDSVRFQSLKSDPETATNILFSSGTTGDPKAIPWSHLTPLKAAVDGHYHHDIRPGDVIAWPTNIGWMMGPWLIYATLINRACIALFEGLPSGRGFTGFVHRAGVSMLGVVPSLVRAWKDSGACDGIDWSMVRVFSSTGEPSNRLDYLWLMSRASYRAPVVEYCGGTEIGGGHVTGTVVQPASPATFSTPALGLDMVILDEEGKPVGEGGEGEVFLLPPSIGLSQELLNRDHDAIYYADCPPGPAGATLRRHGDQMARLAGGYFRAQGRADDTMNLGGIKISSLELERVFERHPAVFEAAAVAVRLDGEGAEKLVVFVVLTKEAEIQTLRQELGKSVASELNPLFKIHDVVVVESLPRTASNKLMRRELRGNY
ncbi:MAG: AMP-binding protein [Thermoanaerobaculales bacterium]